MLFDTLLINNDNLLYVSGLRNELTDEFVNTAFVNARLQTAAGVDVAGQVWPAALDYVPESDGVYRLLLKDSLALANGHYYKLSVTADGGGLKASWNLIFKAAVRAS